MIKVNKFNSYIQTQFTKTFSIINRSFFNFITFFQTGQVHTDYAQIDKTHSDIHKRLRAEIARYQRLKLDTFTVKRKLTSSMTQSPPQTNRAMSVSSGHSSIIDTFHPHSQRSKTMNGSSNEGSDSDITTIFNDSETMSIIENVICAFLNENRGFSYSSGLIHICGLLTVTLAKEDDIYYCFESIQNIISLSSIIHHSFMIYS